VTRCGHDDHVGIAGTVSTEIDQFGGIGKAREDEHHENQAIELPEPAIDEESSCGRPVEGDRVVSRAVGQSLMTTYLSSQGTGRCHSWYGVNDLLKVSTVMYLTDHGSVGLPSGPLT
jgi:hypothetical protein